MASTSGTKHPVGMSQKSLSRRFSRNPSTITEELVDSEIIPQSLAADIAPILHVADEIEPTNPRVAYLCRSHSLEKANNLDPLSSGRYVRQFKTYLSHKLEKETLDTMLPRYLPFSFPSKMVLLNNIDLLNPPAELEKKRHKLKHLVQSLNSFFMDVKCQGCFNITTIFSHLQTVVVCGNCETVLC